MADSDILSADTFRKLVSIGQTRPFYVRCNLSSLIVNIFVNFRLVELVTSTVIE